MLAITQKCLAPSDGQIRLCVRINKAIAQPSTALVVTLSYLGVC